jgi:hypothetical protein
VVGGTVEDLVLGLAGSANPVPGYYNKMLRWGLPMES